MLLIIKIVIKLQTAKFKITSKIRHGMQEVIGSTPIFSTDYQPLMNIRKWLFCVILFSNRSVTTRSRLNRHKVPLRSV
jgi:hypothetical protein